MNIRSLTFTTLLIVGWLMPVFADGTQRLDINSASVFQLSENLPGIGPTKAQRIVDFRNVNGPFTDVEDLVQVKGIGPKTIERLRALIQLGTSESSLRRSREQQQRESKARIKVRNILAGAREASREAAKQANREVKGSNSSALQK